MRVYVYMHAYTYMHVQVFARRIKRDSTSRRQAYVVSFLWEGTVCTKLSSSSNASLAESSRFSFLIRTLGPVGGLSEKVWGCTSTPETAQVEGEDKSPPQATFSASATWLHGILAATVTKVLQAGCSLWLLLSMTATLGFLSCEQAPCAHQVVDLF